MQFIRQAINRWLTYEYYICDLVPFKYETKSAHNYRWRHRIPHQMRHILSRLSSKQVSINFRRKSTLCYGRQMSSTYHQPAQGRLCRLCCHHRRRHLYMRQIGRRVTAHQHMGPCLCRVFHGRTWCEWRLRHDRPATYDTRSMTSLSCSTASRRTVCYTCHCCIRRQDNSWRCCLWDQRQWQATASPVIEHKMQLRWRQRNTTRTKILNAL